VVALFKASNSVYRSMSSQWFAQLTTTQPIDQNRCTFIRKEKIMKKRNVLLITGLVLMLTCGTAMAFNYSTSDGGGKQVTLEEYREPDSRPAANAPVPEPATLLLLGGGLLALGAGARKKNK
jgi:hypothetical protein